MNSLSGGPGFDLSSAFDFLGGDDYDSSDQVSESPYPVIMSPTIPANSSGSLTAAQLANLIGSAASAGSAVLRSTQTPSVIQGTNAIYNPATGQIIAPGVGSGTPQISAGFTISPIVVVIALAAVVAFMGGRK